MALQCRCPRTAHPRGPIIAQLPTPPHLPPPTPLPRLQATPPHQPQAITLHPQRPTAGALWSLPAAPHGCQTTASLRSLHLARLPPPSASKPCPEGPLPTPLRGPKCLPWPGASFSGLSASQLAAGLRSVATVITSSGMVPLCHGVGALGAWRGWWVLVHHLNSVVGQGVRGRAGIGRRLSTRQPQAPLACHLV